MRLYIVYGSESTLLKELFSPNNRYIRIYNKNKPKYNTNCLDVSSNDIKQLSELIKNELKNYEYDNVIFIGAGFYTENKILVDLNEFDIESSINTNVVNYIKIIQIIIKSVPVKINKSFIYLSSFKSKKLGIGTSLYSAGKMFGETFFKNIAKEYARFNVKTVSIRMGYFEGRMLSIFNSNEIQEIKKTIPLRRMGKSDELIKAINFCIDNNYISGGVLDLHGGVEND